VRDPQRAARGQQRESDGDCRGERPCPAHATSLTGHSCAYKPPARQTIGSRKAGSSKIVPAMRASEAP
jgi:hypothetical protein